MYQVGWLYACHINDPHTLLQWQSPFMAETEPTGGYARNLTQYYCVRLGARTPFHLVSASTCTGTVTVPVQVQSIYWITRIRRQVEIAVLNGIEPRNCIEEGIAIRISSIGAIQFQLYCEYPW